MITINYVRILCLRVFVEILSPYTITHYLTGSCSAGDDYFDVEFPVEANQNSTSLRHHQGISIQKPALLMRYPPQYYAVFWGDVTSISFKVLDDNLNNGILAITFKETFGSSKTDELGTIPESCWNDLSQFVHSSGIKVSVEIHK